MMFMMMMMMLKAYSLKCPLCFYSEWIVTFAVTLSQVLIIEQEYNHYIHVYFHNIENASGVDSLYNMHHGPAVVFVDW
jgi:hypothetical protein